MKDNTVTITPLTEDERKKYLAMNPGVTQDAEVIRWIADNDRERHIIELRAYGYNKIRIVKE
jgi:hypothetical protein